jgi:pimeloyl-ACP methyl ester carboxylesterase
MQNSNALNIAFSYRHFLQLRTAIAKWRHQLEALAKEGFWAIAPDLRGYGQTEKPEAIDQYTLFHLIGDMIGLLDALNIEKAAVIGHDWGAPVASHCALFRPDRFAALSTLSVPPFRPRSPARPTSLMPKTENAQFYQLYFQKPGEAEAEFEGRLAIWRRVGCSLSRA